MPLSRIDAICRALALDFADLARRVADSQPLLQELTQEQEKAVVSDKSCCWWPSRCSASGRWSRS